MKNLLLFLKKFMCLIFGHKHFNYFDGEKHIYFCIRCKKSLDSNEKDSFVLWCKIFGHKHFCIASFPVEKKYIEKDNSEDEVIKLSLKKFEEDDIYREAWLNKSSKRIHYKYEFHENGELKYSPQKVFLSACDRCNADSLDAFVIKNHPYRWSLLCLMIGHNKQGIGGCSRCHKDTIGKK